MSELTTAVLILCAAFGGLGAWIAVQKRRNPWEGLVIGGVFWIIGVLVEVLLPTLTAEERAAADKERREREAARRKREEAIWGASEEAYRRSTALRRQEEAESRALRVGAEVEKADVLAAATADAKAVWGAAKGWWAACPDVVQALLLGAAIAVPIGVVVVLIFNR